MALSIDFAPYFSWPVLWTVTGAAVLLALVVLYRARRGALLRVASLALLLTALANPMLRQEEREQLSNIAVVLTDTSPSQSVAQRRQRARLIETAVVERLGQLRDLEVRLIEVDGNTGLDGTYMFDALNRALTGIPADRLAGVFLITDGQIHDVPASSDALGIDAPVHALLSGTKNEFDRRIEVLKSPRFGLLGSQREVELRITEEGRSSQPGRVVTLRVRREGKPDLVRRTIIGERFKVPFEFTHAGKNIIELELKPTAGELTNANNRIVITAEGVRENLRVLLVSGEPHAGERTWRNLLKSDAAVDLVHFTILRPPEKQDGTPTHQLSLIAFPTRELFSEKLHDFDLIIFDRYQRRGVLPLLYLDNIARYVSEHGGAVLVAAGENYANTLSLYRTPLSDVLPATPTGRVIEQPFKPRITSEGQRHPVTRALPGSSTSEPNWGRWFRIVEANPTSGKTLMVGAGDRPLLVLERKGKGRVAILLSDHAWLWARGLEGGGPYRPLFRRLAHWLMKEPDLEEEYLTAVGQGMNLVIERRSMLEEIPPAMVTPPSGPARQVTLQPAGPGVWRETIAVDQPGLYKVQVGALSATGHAGNPDSQEMSQVVTTAAKLEPVVAGTGGGIVWAGNLEPAAAVALPRISMLKSAKVMHGSGWLGLRDRDAFITRGIRLTPLFTGFLALAALLGLLACTWWREGK